MNFLCVLHTLSEASTRLGKASLGFRLQLKQLSVLVVQLARSINELALDAPALSARKLRYSRLCLHSQAAVKRDWVKRLSKAVVNVVIKVYTTGRD